MMKKYRWMNFGRLLAKVMEEESPVRLKNVGPANNHVHKVWAPADQSLANSQHPRQRAMWRTKADPQELQHLQVPLKAVVEELALVNHLELQL